MGLSWEYESAQESFFKKNLDDEFEVVPFPRDVNADRYYMAADTYGFLIPTGAKNIQGCVDWILCGRLTVTAPEIIAKDRAKLMNANSVYYPKCPECKYNFTENNQEELSVCPECNSARKQKFKAVYSERVMRVCDDMINSDLFLITLLDSAMNFFLFLQVVKNHFMIVTPTQDIMPLWSR